jgi:predicted secreted protein
MQEDLDAAHEAYHNSYLQCKEESEAAERQYKKELEALDKEGERDHGAYIAVWIAQGHDWETPQLSAAHKAYEAACTDITTRQRESWRRYWDAQHKIDNALTEAHERYLAVWSRERQEA